MEYLMGDKKDFQNFINTITENDKVAILTHTDLDGIASGIFLEEILKTKDIVPNLIRFINLKKGLFKEETPRLKEKQITKIFLTDINADGFKDFENFCKDFDTFLIDHHPISPFSKNKKNIIKTETRNCSALTVYDLGKNIINQKKWIWLVCAAIIADFAFRKKENLEFVQNYYKDVKSEEGIFESTPGIFCQKITYGLIYYSKDIKKVYELTKEKNLKELNKIYEKIQNEIDKYLQDFEKNAEFSKEKSLYLYNLNPKFNIASIICSMLSQKEPKKSFIFISKIGKDDILKISARNQSGNKDMGKLLQEATKNLKGASAGGHINAAGGTIIKKDLEKFKENLLK